MPSVSSIPGSPEIEVIVVGCGFAGLACAIESRRKGHKVILLEKRTALKDLGDSISFAPNSGRLFEYWGLGEQLVDICTQHPLMHMHNYTGELLTAQPLPQKLYGSNSYNGRRGEIHDVLLRYAKKLGVDVRFEQNVEGYWEDEKGGRAGVVVNGKKIDGDVVVGADGARSRARELVLGFEDKPKPSGYAVYRAWFNSKEQGIDKDPLTSVFYKKGGEFHGWIGQDIHMLAMSFRDGEEMCWVMTHKDNDDIGESWSLPGTISEALSYVKGWDPRCRALIEKTPSCIDWKLVWRDPLPTWVSAGARIVIIGDAAHPYLPTSIQGASQGVEDGVALAITLELAGKKNVHLATRTFEHIRYDRVCRAQAQGVTTRDKLHKNPEERVDGDFEMPFPEWLLNFDVSKHTTEMYEGVAREILTDGYVRPSERVIKGGKIE
ncbi:monooxygenase [Phellopilus nigrolimitatus]|nr:monooxygenase [Phellopilus nigrolimitatus]